MAFDEGKYDVAAAIAGFFKDRKDARDTYLNQPLVQVWDDESGTMVYKRRSEAVGMSSSEKINYNNKFDEYVDNLDDFYYDKQSPDADGNVNYKAIADSDLVTNLKYDGRNVDPEQPEKVMTKADYEQAIGLISQYGENTYGPKDGTGTESIKYDDAQKLNISTNKKELARWNAILDNQDSFVSNGQTITIKKESIINPNTRQPWDLQSKEGRDKFYEYALTMRDSYKEKLTEFGADFTDPLEAYNKSRSINPNNVTKPKPTGNY
tara:strand:+ start:245 stop:1039 length:795 start_codon:yes stop_codon:yes gene_type:complete